MQIIKKTIIPLYFLFLFFCTSSIHAENISNKQLALTFTLIQNNETSQNYTATIVLKNLQTLPHSGEWLLAFNSVRSLLSADQASIVEQKQGGDFYILKFNIPEKTNSISFTVTGKWWVRKYTDAPSGYFLIENFNNQNNQSSAKIIPVQSETILPGWKPGPGEDEDSKNKIKNNTSIEGNPVDSVLTSNTSLIVPLPVELERRPGQFFLNKDTIIFYDVAAKEPARFFAKAIQLATGYFLTAQENKTAVVAPNSILLTTQGTDTLDENQRKEGYILEVTPSAIVIRAVSESGFFYGLQSLRQLFPPMIFSHRLQPNTAWEVPSVYIRDYPRFEYRGLQLDVARHFIPADQVKRLIDLMAIHKLNYFQWHLTDDEGWRIEIKKYPELTAIGAWRGYKPEKNNERALLPAFGSGAKSYGGFYSQEEIRDVVRYAKERHVSIVPEIDIPGHARAMIVSLAQTLIDQTDRSEYTSIQGYHDNVLSPCKKETFTVIEDILTEVAALFPGKYIHVGGDEVPQGAWEKSCMASKFDPKNPLFKELVQNDFMQRVQMIIQSKGKIMAGWEEVASENSTLAAPLRVYIWNTAKINQAYQKSARQGFEVIMGPAENLYFDLAYSPDSKEPGQYWAGYVDTFSAYSFAPIDTKKGQDAMVIKGVQGQLWSEMIDSSDRLDYLAFPKVTALSELAWTQAARRNWQNFSARLREKHLPRLDYYDVHYREVEFRASN